MNIMKKIFERSAGWQKRINQLFFIKQINFLKSEGNFMLFKLKKKKEIIILNNLKTKN